MKFGKTKKQIQEERLEHLTKMMKEGEIRFAWKPVKLTAGSYVWLEKYRSSWVLKGKPESYQVESMISEHVRTGTFPLDYGLKVKIVEEYESIN